MTQPTEAINRIYDQYFSKTGDPVAAATLTLAQVQTANAWRPADSSPSPGGGDAVLNPPDVAKQLHASPAKVIGWIKSGQLKAANVATGKRPRYVIQRADLDRFLQSRQPDPPVSRRRSGRARRRTPADRY